MNGSLRRRVDGNAEKNGKDRREEQEDHDTVSLRDRLKQ